MSGTEPGLQDLHRNRSAEWGRPVFFRDRAAGTDTHRDRAAETDAHRDRVAETDAHTGTETHRGRCARRARKKEIRTANRHTTLWESKISHCN